MHPARILLLLAAASAALPAQTPSPAPPAGGQSTLDPKVIKIIEEARTLQSKQRSFEALAKLDQAEALLPNSALIANIRGSIYTAPPLKDFEKARECFEKAERLMPDAFEPRFNKTELLYVTGKFADAEAGFTRILADYPKLREEVRHLVHFKIIICQLKQGRVADAEKSSGTFTFMDDTPAYYFAKAAFAFQKDDLPTARSWVEKGTRIFKPPQTAVYLDTLMEAGWITNISVGNPAR